MAAAAPEPGVVGMLGDLFTRAVSSPWLWRIAISLAIALVGLWLARVLSRALDRGMARFGVEAILRDFLRNLTYAIALVVVMVAALDSLGVPTTSLLAVLGAAGLAIGLALKDSLSNIASGVMLIVLRPFRAGDHVIAAGEEGIVSEVRIFQTRLRAFDQRMIILPNSQITTAPIINYTSLPTRRLEITVGVGYEDDLKRAQQILMGIAKANPLILADPAPFVQVVSLGESSVDLKLFAHCKNMDFGDARSQLIEAVRNQIIESGLSIPYPQRDLHVYHHNPDGTPLTDIITRSVADDGDVRADGAT